MTIVLKCFSKLWSGFLKDDVNTGNVSITKIEFLLSGIIYNLIKLKGSAVKEGRREIRP